MPKVASDTQVASRIPNSQVAAQRSATASRSDRQDLFAALVGDTSQSQAARPDTRASDDARQVTRQRPADAPRPASGPRDSAPSSSGPRPANRGGKPAETKSSGAASKDAKAIDQKASDNTTDTTADASAQDQTTAQDGAQGATSTDPATSPDAAIAALTAQAGDAPAKDKSEGDDKATTDADPSAVPGQADGATQAAADPAAAAAVAAPAPAVPAPTPAAGKSGVEAISNNGLSVAATKANAHSPVASTDETASTDVDTVEGSSDGASAEKTGAGHGKNTAATAPSAQAAAATAQSKADGATSDAAAKPDTGETKTQAAATDGDDKAAAAAKAQPHAARADADKVQKADPKGPAPAAQQENPAFSLNSVGQPPVAPPTVQPSHIALLQQASGTANTAAAVPVDGVPVQIAAHAQAGKNNFEIRLDPPELGRIEVRLHVDRDGQISSHVIADRQDTLDLLRRDSGNLERALQDAGLKTSGNGLQFSLRDQSSQQGQFDQQRPTANLIATDSPPVASDIVEPAYRALAASRGGLDIRV